MSAAPTVRIIVIMPCMNESGRIGSVVQDVLRALPEVEVAVIDDASTDATADEARAAGATILPHVVNMGYGTALETGYLYALSRGADIVLQLDGDGQHVPGELPKLVAPLLADEADLVIGSRYLDGGDYAQSAMRRSGQHLFGAIVRLITGQRFTDPTSGFQGLNRKTIALYTAGLFPNDYPDADILLTAHLAGLRVKEVPVSMLQRESGQSMHTNLTAGYYVIKMLLSMFIAVLNTKTFRKEIERCTSNLASS